MKSTNIETRVCPNCRALQARAERAEVLYYDDDAEKWYWRQNRDPMELPPFLAAHLERKAASAVKVAKLARFVHLARVVRGLG